ncbi:hypothetical protein M2103_000365 [Ereboglobus sp. PH5-5]|nr:hypothetical protein [Ereboglobus sp. PH5-5]
MIPPKHVLLRHLVALLLAFAVNTHAFASAEIAADTTGPDFKTITFQNGSSGYTGTVDVRVAKKIPDAHDPKSAVFWIQYERDPETNKFKNNSVALLRFDNLFGSAPGQIPLGSPIVKATLRLHSGHSKNADSRNRLNLNRMLVPWDASAAWNYPAWGRNGIQADDREAAAEPDDLAIFNERDVARDFDVTRTLRAWSGGAPNHGWFLHHVFRKTSNALGIVSSYSKTAQKRPQLTITYDANPANRAPVAANLAAARAAPGSATLSLRADDPDGGPLTVTFLARRRPAAARDFNLVLLPDTQYYVRERHNGTPAMFIAQTDWVIRHARPLNIAAVLHLGDITDRGDVERNEWVNAVNAMYRLGDPAATGRPDGIPYILAVGNHDQRYENGTWEGPATLFNEYFGVKHFSQKSYYGGHYGKNNNNYYIFFDSGPEKFVVVSLEYDAPAKRPEVLQWADGILKKHADRRAIIITHSTLTPGIQSAHTKDGAAAYAALKGNKNLMLIIGGHITGEGRRTDTFNGSTVHSILMDFQSDKNGGDGMLGILTLSPRTNKIHAAVFSPHTNRGRLDGNATYTLDYDFGAKIEPFAKVATVEISAGATATATLDNMDANATYEWVAEISDKGKTTRTPARAISNK